MQTRNRPTRLTFAQRQAQRARREALQMVPVWIAVLAMVAVVGLAIGQGATL